MKLRFANLTKEGSKGAIVSPQLDSVTFYSTTPAIIQPLEIQKVQIGLVCEIPQGYVLNVSTHPKLIDQASEVFPNLLVIDYNYQGELLVPVRNSGRNPLSLMPNTPIAVGHLVKIEQIEIEGFDYEVPKIQPKSTPQKKNPFSFEVK